MDTIYRRRAGLCINAAAMILLSGICCSAAIKDNSTSKAPTVFNKNLAPPPALQMIYATGEGAIANAKEQPNRAKAYLEAKSYAKMQAIASLVEIAKGTMIKLTSNGDGYTAKTYLKQDIDGVLDSIQVVSTSKRSVDKDIIVAVTVRAPKPKVNKAASNKVSKQAKTVPSWMPDATPTAGAKSSAAARGYTSVIIDAQGLGIDRCMSPKILRADGTEVWGTLKSDQDFVSDYGIAAYANSRANALASRRCGERPLMIRALARGSSASDGDVVISSADAQLIEESNRESHFLDDFRVIIVVDPSDTSRSRLVYNRR